MQIKVIPISNTTPIYPGQEVDIELEGETLTGYLTPAAISKNPKKICYIKAMAYSLQLDDIKSGKEYSLGNSRLKCEYKEGIVIPLLRESKGRESLVFKKYKKGVWQNELKGVDCPYWPIIE